ncbi:VOC family protein [Dyella monticola]|uniref:VOC family protein n=1 Tax=Dyella monticola TaxID=1927958 RepID=A0A370X3T5_9GAMM|nr:VOC family protein [Dyella monticola]RDS83069.1 VOC family protein [Dyella monticola]
MPNAFRAARDVIIRTHAWDDAVAFYTSVLGLEVVHRSEKLVGLEAGAFRLYVEKGENHGPVFEWLVPDVPAAKHALLARGCTVVEEDASAPRCYIRDPYGLTFNIGQSDARCGGRGGLCL